MVSVIITMRMIIIMINNKNKIKSISSDRRNLDEPFLANRLHGRE
jgi:hypothetical protein